MERAEPMISGLAMIVSPVSARAVRQPVKGGRPAGGVTVARLPAVETPLHQHETGAARRCLECHQHLGFVAARPVVAFPGPCEGKAMRRFDEAVDSAGR